MSPPPPAMQHPFHLMPDMMVGPFRLQARLGAGGFGAVFRAECGGELYALKFAVHGPESEDLNLTDARAQRELECLLLTRHPNVVRVWAHGRWPHPRTGYLYVVMDYVEGPTLLEWARRTHPTPRQVVKLFSTLALTLDALHAQGLHHRDLKGSNILVRQKDGEPVLVDFGAGEHVALGAALTEGSLPPGTAHLRTPEALRFHREQYADPLARYVFRPSDDLYALGCTLYEVLTGSPPFPPTLPRELLVSLIEKELPPSPAVLNPQVPEPLAKLVLRLLAKRPEQRPESGQALDEQLQALLQQASPAWDVPLSPGSEALTTEGVGLALVPAPSAPTVATAATEQEVAGPPRQRRWVAAVALVLLVGVLGALWRGASLPPPLKAPTASEPVLPPAPPLMASAPRDAGSPAEPEAPSFLPQTKGQPMNPPTKSPDTSRQPEQARAPGGPKKSSKLPGVVAVCTLAAGCASAPPVKKGPPSELPCPEGAVETMTKKFHLESLWKERLSFPPATAEAFDFEERVTITEGRHEVVIMDGLWDRGIEAMGLSDPIILVGDFTISDRVYARFFELRAGGKSYPWCAKLMSFPSEPRVREGSEIEAVLGPGEVRIRGFQRAAIAVEGY